jgi:uncharacterized protein (TIGR02147 family)
VALKPFFFAKYLFALAFFVLMTYILVIKMFDPAKSMIDLFIHLDYRSYLRAIYQYKKANLPRFSFAKMSQELGFKDRTFIQHILSGAKELPKSSTSLVIAGLNLNDEQAQYFTHLVDFAHATESLEKEALWKSIRAKSLNARNEVDMASQRVELLEEWYGFPIKDLLCLGVTEVKDIQQSLCSAVSADDIQKTIQKLISLEFVELSEEGIFYDLEPALSTPTQEEFAQAVRHFQGEMQLKAKEALHYAKPHEREFQTLSMSLSSVAFDQIVQVIRETRDTLISIYENDQDPKSAIYQCNLTIFPIAHLPQPRSEENS